MNKEINLILGERVKSLRKKQGYTREMFAEKTSVSSRFLADLESGKVGVSISTLKQMAQALNTSSDYLIGITDLNSEELNKNSVINKINKFSPEQLKKLDEIIDCILSIAEHHLS